MGLTILGTGSALPATVKTNCDLAEFLDTSDQWISTRTGIRQRHICVEETLTQLAARAAVLALEQAQTSPEELDLILCATLCGDTLSPSQACLIQQQLGATCPAMDLNAACSGFLYGLDVADGYFARRRAHRPVRRILLVAVEGMSRLVDWTDRSTCVLFGDGAAAAVLGPGEDLLSILLTAKGTADPLCLPGLNGNGPFGAPDRGAPYLGMQGGEVYKFAVSAIGRDLEQAVEQAGVPPEAIDHVLLHQANQRIIEAAQRRSTIPAQRFAMNIASYGNTSAASVPLLLDEMNRSGQLKKGQLLALCAFGAGLTTGACVLRWNRCAEKIEQTPAAE